MKREWHVDGSCSCRYEDDDIVEVVKPTGNPSVKVGARGRVRLTDLEDRVRGHSTLISRFVLDLSGHSEPHSPFGYRIRVHAFHVKPYEE